MKCGSSAARCRRRRLRRATGVIGRGRSRRTRGAHAEAGTAWGRFVYGNTRWRRRARNISENPVDTPSTVFYFSRCPLGHLKKLLALSFLRRRAGAMVFYRLQVSDGIRIEDLAGAHVAQLVEHILGKDEVISSILIMGSRLQH